MVSEDVGVDFSVLFEREYAPLCRLAQLLVDDRSRAEEIVQEALARSLAARPNLRDPRAAPIYVRRAVINACRSELRHRRLERRIGSTRRLAGRSLDDAPATEQAWEDTHAERQRVLDAVRTLPMRQREIVVLRYYLDLDEQGVADLSGVALGTVKSQLARAKARLAPLLLRTEEDIS